MLKVNQGLLDADFDLVFD